MIAMTVALICNRPAANPTVERGPPKKTKKRKNKKPRSVAMQAKSQQLQKFKIKEIYLVLTVD